MSLFVGAVLIAAGLAALLRGFRWAPGAGRDRRFLGWGIAGLVAGLYFALQPGIALARLRPAPLARHDRWTVNPEASSGGPIHWDGNALVAELEVGSDRYAVFPVDWDANRFQASWDITFERLDRVGDEIELKEGGRTVSHRRSAQDFASVTVGLMDANVANIDDRDHVSGSAVEACFSDDIRLRASDSSLIVRTASHDESGKLTADPSFRPQRQGVRIELGQRYHCDLSYDAGRSSAALEVRDASGRTVVSRRLEDLKDLTTSVTWFGVSIRGYNRFDKRLDPAKGDTGYTRPRVTVRLENMEYRQP
jgi:hypothetical protein